MERSACKYPSAAAQQVAMRGVLRRRRDSLYPLDHAIGGIFGEYDPVAYRSLSHTDSTEGTRDGVLSNCTRVRGVAGRG